MSDAKTTLEELKKKVIAPAPVAEKSADEKSQDESIEVMKTILDELCQRYTEQNAEIEELTNILAAIYEQQKFHEERIAAIENKLFGGVAQRVVEDEPKEADKTETEEELKAEEPKPEPEKKKSIVAKILKK